MLKSLRILAESQEVASTSGRTDESAPEEQASAGNDTDSRARGPSGPALTNRHNRGYSSQGWAGDTRGAHKGPSSFPVRLNGLSQTTTRRDIARLFAGFSIGEFNIKCARLLHMAVPHHQEIAHQTSRHVSSCSVFQGAAGCRAWRSMIACCSQPMLALEDGVMPYLTAPGDMRVQAGVRPRDAAGGELLGAVRQPRGAAARSVPCTNPTWCAAADGPVSKSAPRLHRSCKDLSTSLQECARRSPAEMLP